MNAQEKYQDSRVRGPHQDSRVNQPVDSRIRVQGHTVEDIKSIVRQVLTEDDYRGQPGKDSVVPGPKVKLSIGSVCAGDSASAMLRDDGDNQLLDLVLPRGADGKPGKDSSVPGPVGSSGSVGATGAAGRDGKDAPSLEEIKGTIVEVLRSEEMRQSYRGERGEGVTGPAGRDASVEDIRKVVLELLASQEIRDQYRGERGQPGESIEGKPGRNPDKQEVQQWILDILRRNGVLR